MFLTVLPSLSMTAQEPQTVKVPDETQVVLPVEGKPELLFLSYKENKTLDILTKWQVGCIDIRTNQILWQNSSNGNTALVQLSNLGYISSGKGLYADKFKTRFFDADKGKERYKIKFLPCYTDIGQDIMVGYKGIAQYGEGLSAYRISTGENLWTAATLEGGDMGIWSMTEKVDDDHIVFLAKDLVRLNIKSGAMDFCNVQTSSSGGLSSYVMQFSNILHDGDNFYFSDAAHLQCLGNRFQQIWTVDFDSKGTDTHLVIRGDTLIMLNTGTVLKNGYKPVNKAQPYVATYDKNTGRQLSKELFPETWDKDLYGKALLFDADTVYVKNGNRFEPIASDAHHFLLYDKDDNPHWVDTKLQTLKLYDDSLIYRDQLHTQGYRIILHVTEVNKKQATYDYYILDNDYNILRHLEGSPRFVAITRDKRLVVLYEGIATIEVLP
ncbi:MAG: hypothetical protein ACOYJG_08900 [Prevotella sp.]